MSLIDIFLLAIALGIDCLVVSFSQGLIFNSEKIKNAISLAITMGLFQGLMPVIGYVGTHKIYDILIPYGKYIVFSIFLLLGMHFIFESFQIKTEEKICCIGFKCLMGLGIATSIDALISGVTLRLTSANLILSCFIIGILSFIMSIIGFWCGTRIKNIPSKYLEVLGGTILVILAIKSII